MVLINRIYTRTGDAGTTRLASGAEVSKSDLRVAAYGDVDEANACLGLARLHTTGTDLDPLLARLQNELFDLGADLATPPGPAEDRALRILDSQVARLEAEIDALNAGLGELTSFILPGGSPAAARARRSASWLNSLGIRSHPKCQPLASARPIAWTTGRAASALRTCAAPAPRLMIAGESPTTRQ